MGELGERRFVDEGESSGFWPFSGRLLGITEEAWDELDLWSKCSVWGRFLQREVYLTSGNSQTNPKHWDGSGARHSVLPLVRPRKFRWLTVEVEKDGASGTFGECDGDLSTSSVRASKGDDAVAGLQGVLGHGRDLMGEGKWFSQWKCCFSST